jgi:hypothetical protein
MPQKKSRPSDPLADAMSRQQYLDRYILHLRQRLRRRNLNLVLGAGATKDAGAPLWPTLVGRLREALSDIRSASSKDASQTFGPAMAAQILFTG